MTELIRQEAMNSRHRTLIKRIMLVITMMLVMLVLCGCRTRLTNNDEVSNVIYDEEGYRYDEYQMRRDELGLSTAKKPIFTGFGTPEDDSDYYDYGSDSQMLEDYEPSEEDVYPEDEEESSSSSSSSSSRRQSGSSSRRVIRHGSSSRRSSSGSKKITINLEKNAEEAILDKDTVSVTIGGKYPSLPNPEWEGHTFKGWYTKSSGGTRINTGDTVRSLKENILYAHWGKSGEKVNDYTIAFDLKRPEGATEDPVPSEVKSTKTENGNYPQLQKDLFCKGFVFRGWFTKDGKEAKAGEKADSTADTITLYARWDPAAEYWADVLDDLVREDEIAFTYWSNGENTEFLNTIGREDKDNYDYLVIFGDKAEKGSKPTILIPASAVDGSPEKELLYKYKLFNVLRGQDKDQDKKAVDLTPIAKDLGISLDDIDIDKVEIIDAADDSGDDPGDDPGDNSGESSGEGTGGNEEGNEGSETGGEGESGE